MTNSGRRFVSRYSRPTYSPRMPKRKSWVEPRISTTVSKLAPAFDYMAGRPASERVAERQEAQTAERQTEIEKQARSGMIENDVSASNASPIILASG